MRVTKVDFLFIGKDRLQNIRQHYLSVGLLPRQHKSAGKRAHNCLLYADIRLILNFLVNYAEEHAILLPGRVPTYKRFDVQLLPSSTTKQVHKYKLNTKQSVTDTFLRWYGHSMQCAVLKHESVLLHTQPS